MRTGPLFFPIFALSQTIPRMKRAVLIISSILLLMSGCQKDEVRYDVDATLDPYLQLFISEASKRGIVLNPEEGGLLMRFADLDAPTIGLCTYSDPLLVQIDRTYWADVLQYDNCEDLRQNVVFHELAHGLLNRRHDNSTLDDSEWKTLMCGGEEVRERSWQVNFSGERRQYYLDELFNTKTEQPEWAEYGAADPGQRGNLVAELETSKSSYRVDSEGSVFQIANGVYSITINSDKITNVTLQRDLSLTGDFYYEVTLKTSALASENLIGLSLGYIEDGRTAFNNLMIYKNQTYNEYRAAITNSKCYPPFAEIILADGLCDLTELTHIAVRRASDELYFYINGKQVYRNDYKADKTYQQVGIILPGKKTVKVNLAAVYNNSNLKGAVVPSQLQVDRVDYDNIVKLNLTNFGK